MVDSVFPNKKLLKFCSAMKVFKGKKKINLNHGDGGSESLSSSTVCRHVNFLWSFFSCYLVHTFCSWRLLKEKLGKRSGHLWITYSSLLLPWSMERTEKLAEGLHVPKIWKVCQGQRSVGHRGAWFKVSDKTRGSPVESFFLQRTLSCQMLLCSFTLWTEGSGTRGSYCRLLRYVATRDPRRDYLLIWACFNITEQHVTPSLAQLSLWS